VALVSLAKLTPPSAARLVPRERLFARLDESRPRHRVWIAAPAGAGKTSLASSWIAARGLRPAWYRIDADDADPATFFHYLARFAPRGGAELPALTPEYLPGLPTYARRFFRTLFDALPAPFALALDNYQEVPAGAMLHILVGILAEEMPPGSVLLTMSRLDPPPALTRSFAQGTVLGWDDLRFTADETGRLIAALGGGDAAAVHAATHGWAAGIVLTARGEGERERGGSIDAGQAPQAVFDYIASECFDRMPAEQRGFLLRVGWLPVVSAPLCAAVSGDARGMQWLAELERERLFVTVPALAEPAYEFHPLFHAFLRRRIDERLDAAGRAELARRVGLALEETGNIHLAADVWSWGGDWGELARLVHIHAPDLLASGQFAAVLAWIERLPVSLRDTSPWLLFWAATCRAMLDPAAARAEFERAFGLFGAAGDVPGQWLCWAGIAETFIFGWDSLASFDPWIEQLEILLARHRGFPSPDVEARVLAGGVALMFRRPDHPLLTIWAERALAMIRGKLALPHTAMLAHFAGFYHMWRGHTRALDAVLETARATGAPKPPLGRILHGLLELVSANFRGDPDGVEAAFAEALAVSSEYGVHVMDVPLIQNAGLAALARGDAERLDALIHMARPLLQRGRWLEAAFQEYLEAGLALLLADMGKARARTLAALELISGQGMPLLVGHIRLFLAHLDILEGRHAAARADMEAHLAQVREARCDLYVAATLLTRAQLDLDAGESPAAAEALREALAIGAQWGYGHLFLYAAPETESRLCDFALESDIEPCYVRRLIQTRGLYPPATPSACWPWPVRVFTLGGFRLALSGEIVRQSGKPQKRPLELLKALAAQGPAGATAQGLGALLWSDAEGGGIRKTLEITLHRLRKLLGRDDAVLLHEGRIALNPRVCWVDLWAFEQAADRAAAALRVVAPDTAEIERESAHALRLYVGGFLATDEEASWLLPARDRALSRFQRLAADLGRYHEQAGDWEAAAELYRRALEQDNLNEFLYRRLIFCLQRQDRHAEALGVYRRCRELLSIVLGVAPSNETEALIGQSR
jgi:ATP/maltotriose-dependent transcriptional regulator MalT/DNA-binding SARP family transcriptional activator